LYWHTIAASVDGSNPTAEDLAEMIAYCKTYQEQGKLSCIKLSDIAAMIGFKAAA